MQLSFLWHSVLKTLSILVSPASQLCLLNSESPMCFICVTPSQPRNILMAVRRYSHRVYCPLLPLLPFIQYFFYSVFWKLCFILIGSFLRFFSDEKVNPVPVNPSWLEAEVFKSEFLVNSMGKVKVFSTKDFIIASLYWDLSFLKNSKSWLISRYLYSKCSIYWVRRKYFINHRWSSPMWRNTITLCYIFYYLAGHGPMKQFPWLFLCSVVM